MTFLEFNRKLKRIFGYFCELDRIQNSDGTYVQKNRVHIFAVDKDEEVAKIYNDMQGHYTIYETLPADVQKLVEEFANTPLMKRGFAEFDEPGYDFASHGVKIRW